MKTYKLNTLGFTDLEFQGPESADEYRQMAVNRTDEEDPLLNDAINKIAYHSTLGNFRDEFAKALEQESGVDRLTEEKELKSTDADGNPLTSTVYTENAPAYLARVCRETNTTVEQWRALAQQVAATTPIDPAGVERKAPKPRKLPQSIQAKVTAYCEAGKLEAVATKMSEVLAREVKADPISVGWAIKEHLDNQRKLEEERMLQGI